MECQTCNEKLAARLRYFFFNGKMESVCDRCGDVPAVWLPDVYLGGPGGTPRTDPNLVDPKTLREMPFSTKREKAVVMKYLNVRQADTAERIHGSRNETKRRTYI